jgi:hypothetical protein
MDMSQKDKKLRGRAQPQSEPPDDYDSPWKEVLERYFEDFMAFFFPAAHADIDWSKEHEFLDKELQKVVREAELGRRLVDKLVKVWRKDGGEVWVLSHIEVQGEEETDFAERVYMYNYRLFDRYHHWVASLIVLADERVGWRPTRFGYELWGCEIGFRFPAVKLLDYRDRWAELEANPNPFALVTMAHLKAQETRGKGEERKRWKWYLTRRLYERGYARADVLNLFRFIDWVMRLPEELEEGFRQEVEQYEEERRMRYVTSIERIGMKKGILQTAREDVIDVLETRFEEVPPSMAEVIQGMEDPSLLKSLLRQAATLGSLEEFEQALPKAA